MAADARRDPRALGRACLLCRSTVGDRGIAVRFRIEHVPHSGTFLERRVGQRREVLRPPCKPRTAKPSRSADKAGMHGNALRCFPRQVSRVRIPSSASTKAPEIGAFCLLESEPRPADPTPYHAGVTPFLSTPHGIDASGSLRTAQDDGRSCSVASLGQELVEVTRDQPNAGAGRRGRRRRGAASRV